MASNSGVVGILANLSFGRKLGLVLAVMSIPILILAAMFVSARNEDIHHAENEARGVEYIGSLRSVMEALQQHRSLANAAINGDNSSRARAEQLQQQIDRSVQGVESVEAKLGPVFQSADRLAQFKRNWQELKLSAMKVSARDSLDNHNRVLNDLYEYVRVIADKSGLIVDQRLDSFYLMLSAVQDLPTITDQISKLGYLVNGALASKNPQERMQVQLIAENVDFKIQSLQRNMAVVYSANSSMEAKIGTSLTSAMRGADPWLRSLREGNLERSAGGGGAIEGAAIASAAFFTLYDAALPNLKGLLEDRGKELTGQKYTQLGFAFIVAMIAIALGMVVNRAITGQIQQVNDAFNLIGSGNYDVRVPVTTRDELGNMALSMNSVLDNTLVLIQSREERNRIQNSIQKLLDDISGVASGDLTQEAEVTAEVTGAIADSFNYMISELRAIVRTVNRTTVEVGESAHQVLTTAEGLAHGSQGQARQIAEATTSVDSMVKSIREVSATAGQAASVAETTFQKAKTGSEAVQKTIQGMGGIRNQVQETSKRLKGLGERSQEIGSIVQLIGDIADRTSILALNASIQAAMAGEAGRGFAVVAEEVERLAERAAEATKKVNALIKSIQADTSEAITAMEETTREVVDGSNLANAAGRALSEIEAVSSQLTNLIHSITATSEEQAAGSDHISKAMAQISTQTKESVEGVKTAATSVQQLATLAEELRHSMQRFRLPSDEPSYVR